MEVGNSLAMEKKFVVRCRGIIIDQGELLLVEHAGKEGVLVLPGGHLEWGEDIKAGLIRELEEELGVTPVVGSLLYIHTYTEDNGKHAVEFFFAINNAADYRTLGNMPTHAHELARVGWITTVETCTIRPTGLGQDFFAGKLGDGILRYLFEGLHI
jgi:ADP-ribose pyrophosphatase YjhB (NUDIX family)